jgi:hypothetical protein
MLKWLEIIIRTVWSVLRTHRALATENLVLRQQLAVLKSRHPRPRLTDADRIFWVVPPENSSCLIVWAFFIASVWFRACLCGTLVKATYGTPLEFPRFPCYSLFLFIASDQANAWRPRYCGVFGSSRVAEGAEKQKIPCKFPVFRQFDGAGFADDCFHRQSFVSLLWWDFSIADLPAEARRWRAFRDVGLGSVRVCEEIALLEAPIIEIFSVARCRGSLSVETGGLISR